MKTPKPCNILGTQQHFDLHLNQVLSCCRAHPLQLDSTKSLNDYNVIWNERKQKLLQGIEITECNYCWKAEHQGKTSFRMQASPELVKEIDISLSSLCNQMCSYCSPKYSSVWNDSIINQGMFTGISASAKNNLTPLDPKSVDSEYWLDQIQKNINHAADDSIILNLLGGEPLMQVNGLKKLLQFDYKKIKKLKITTNFNPPNNKFLHWVIETAPLEKLLFYISLDSTPDYNHIPRAGFKSEKFIENLELIKQHNIQYIIKAHLSVLSIFNIKNFLNWLTLTNSTAEFANLNNPECLYPGVVPAEFRKKIYSELSDCTVPPLIKEVLLNETEEVDIKLFEQYNYLNQYLTRTNIDPLQIDNTLFIEYWIWLTDRYKK